VKRADGTVLTGSLDDQFVHQWSATGEEHIKTIWDWKSDSSSFVTELDSTSLYLTSFNDTTRKYKFRGGCSFHSRGQKVVVLKKARSNNKVAAVLTCAAIELRDVVNDQRLGVMTMPQPRVIVELNDGNLATSGGWDYSCERYKIFIYCTESCQLLQTLEGHTEDVRGLVCLDSGTLVSCSVDKTVKMWDTELGCCIATLYGHTAAVISILKMSNGTIVTASTDKTMRGWNDKGQTLFIAHTEMPIISLCELDDGTVAGGTYGCVERWRLPTHE